MSESTLHLPSNGLASPYFGENASEPGDRWSGFKWFLIYAAFLGATWTIVLSTPKVAGGAAFFVTIGGIAMWRYGWWLIHQVRAVFFLKYAFPALRHRADQIGVIQKVDHVYVMVMSYKIDPREFVNVYKSLIENAIDYGAPTTIVASVTGDGDRALLEQTYARLGSPNNVEIVVQFQRGDGKRSAMGMALRAISRREPSPNSITVFMDGDVVLEPRALARSMPFFLADPNLAGATTNNGAFVDGDYVTRQWYTLRHAQRHALMASMSVSKKLLVLTGRYSLIRTRYAIDPEFIERVENDQIKHWRHGQFRFVSGDDKSTWYFLMTRRAELLYIPDVYAYGLESLPDRNRFIASSTSLMVRWFGNMLRTNGRAIRLGPLRCGTFAWWSLVDQRVSIWTSLVGPAATVLFSILVSPIYVVYYLAWVSVTRLAMSAAAAVAYGKFSFAWPFVMYYNQVWGAALKTFLWFRLNRQGWTRQQIANSAAYTRLERATNTILHVASIGVLFVSVGLITGIFKLPDNVVLNAVFFNAIPRVSAYVSAI